MRIVSPALQRHRPHLSRKVVSSLSVCSASREARISEGDRFARDDAQCAAVSNRTDGVFAAWTHGGQLQPLYTARELEHQLRDSGAKGILVIENFASVLAEVIDRTDVKHVVVTGLGDRLSWWKGPGSTFLVRHVAKLVPEFKFGAAIRFNSALSDGAGGAIAREALGSEDVAFASTGEQPASRRAPSLRRLTTSLPTSAVAGLVVRLSTTTGATSASIAALPLYHIFALTAYRFVYVTMGAKAVPLPIRATCLHLFDSFCANTSSTVLPGVKPLFTALMNQGLREAGFRRVASRRAVAWPVQRATAEESAPVTGTP